jgi:hypothetical protein
MTCIKYNLINPNRKTTHHFCRLKKSKSISEYETIKNRLKYNTLQFGSVYIGYNFIGHEPIDGLSATLGVLSSYGYVTLLSNYVDTIELGSIFPKQFLPPIFVAAFESAWNSNPEAPFYFNCSVSLFGFFVYKLALLTLSYNIVKNDLSDEEIIDTIKQK